MFKKTLFISDKTIHESFIHHGWQEKEKSFILSAYLPKINLSLGLTFCPDNNLPYSSDYFIFLSPNFYIMKHTKYFLVPMLFFVSSLVAVAQEAGNTGNMDSQEFVNEAASGSMMEVALGEMASQKASSEEVKSFGQKMVEDHSKANEELKQIAESNSLTVPETMMDKQQKMVDKLSELSGEEFDKEYMKTMLKDHKKDIKKFEKAASNADNAEIQSWARKTLDVLEQHHQLAEETQQTVEASAN